ncbi:DUF3168 domain-containing protein [Sphingomonas sp. 32-62-10]|uniref:tail completion protein gp17 n=1 Tax=Sphingomonas sp. 32-62-10 TaxID=1970436 RepID=UPI00268EE336
MSAAALFHTAMLAALRNDLAFGGALNGVFEGPAVKATAPYAELGELLVSDWGAKGLAGCELRPAILIRDRAQGPARLHALAAAADAAMAAVPADLGGWRIASLALLRSRIIRDGPGAWVAIVEHRVRILETA